MANDEHVILFAEVNILVGQLEVVLVRAGVNALPLENIFWRDGVELRGEEFISARIGAHDLAFVNGSANVEKAFIRAFERGGGLGNGDSTDYDQSS
jgi:hypothetical protein